MKTLIFNSYEEFLSYEYKSINGVSKEFAELYNIKNGSESPNAFCWNCWNCEDCTYCINCIDCADCDDCKGCMNCKGCRALNNDFDCEGYDGLSDEADLDYLF